MSTDHPSWVKGSIPIPSEVLNKINNDLLLWAVDRWYQEVSQRPLVNVHRRTLDDTWRQVVRKLGGNDIELLGPVHDI